MGNSSVWHRQFGKDYPVAVSARGVRIIDRDGKIYLDASGGAAVSCLGHNHPDVRAAIHAQVDQIAYAHTSFFTTEVAEELGQVLVRNAPAGTSLAYFVSGGSEAVEAALKMARQYFVEIGQPQRRHFIGRRQSYHGNTLGALAVGGNAARRAPFVPLLAPVTHVSACYEYRDRQPHETAEQYGARLVAELGQAIDTLGPETVIAFVAETVGGATAGVLTAVPGYFQGVRDLCDRHGILLILDEVMCGMGRTGTLHACEAEGVVPDLMTVAKGLGGGYQPIGAVLAQRRVADVIAAGSGAIQHGHTYQGHPVACAAALAVQRVIERDRLLERVRAMGERLRAGLLAEFSHHPHVGDVRGRGLFQAIELVQHRDTKQSFDPSLQLHARIKRFAMQEGMCCYPVGGTIDGRVGDHVVLAPPFIIQPSEVDEIVSKLSRAIKLAVDSVGHSMRLQ